VQTEWFREGEPHTPATSAASVPTEEDELRLAEQWQRRRVRRVKLYATA
jgi:hypothetical protein